MGNPYLRARIAFFVLAFHSQDGGAPRGSHADLVNKRCHSIGQNYRRPEKAPLDDHQWLLLTNSSPTLYSKYMLILWIGDLTQLDKFHKPIKDFIWSGQEMYITKPLRGLSKGS